MGRHIAGQPRVAEPELKRHVVAIKRLLKERDISQRRLADECGFSRQTVHSLLNNGNVGIATLEKIADYFKVDISVLFPPPVTETVKEDANKDIDHLLMAYLLKNLHK